MIALILLSLELQAQVGNDTINHEAEDFVEAYLVTVEPGGALYSVFGHSCLHLVCKSYDMDYYFTYESENVEEKILTFLSGNLKMGLARLTADEYLGSYREEGRGVTEYRLLLPLRYKKELWRVLDEHVDEGMYLPYDFEARGCAYACHIMLREALGDTPIQFGVWDEHLGGTRREILYNYAHGTHPWTVAFVSVLVGFKGDALLPNEEKLVLPADLVEAWQNATVDGVPVLSKEPIEVSPSAIEQPHPWCTPLLVSVILLLCSIAGLFAMKVPAKEVRILNMVFDSAMWIVLTLIGALETYLVCFSSLPCTEWNWLIIPFNILPAVGWCWRRYWSLPFAIIIAIWVLGVGGYSLCFHMLTDWSLIVFAASFGILSLKQWIQTKNTKQYETKIE